MNERYMFSIIAVTLLILFAYAGVAVVDGRVFFGVIAPAAAAAVFLIGIVWRVLHWAKSPVPFAIPTTAGQQKTLPWIPTSHVDNPSTKLGVVVRMAFEILLFRSLFRNTKMKFREGDRISYLWELWLWIFALAFHYAFLVVIVRHLRLFTEPVPFFVPILEEIDGFVQFGLPGVFISGFVMVAALIFLLLRRMLLPQIRYISLASDFFPLFLLIAIGVSGILMRHGTKTDIVGVKTLLVGLLTFQFPRIPDTIGSVFYIHVFLVSVLLAYFPFSKLTHLAGVFLSPTRNLRGNTREYRHVNPWNYPVKVHTYEEYEDEFRDKMAEMGIPVEKPPAPEPAAQAEESTSESEKE